MSGELARVDEAAIVLRAAGADRARLGLVLGSGLRSFAACMRNARELPFATIPHWPVPKVEGHGGSLLVGDSPAEVTRAVRTLARLGVREFVLTNAAGGIGDGLRAGDLMAITDHLNLTGASPLIGPQVKELGPRFPDQSRVWDEALRERLVAVDARLARGVYAGLLGPSYETPAEVRMLRALGADAVGMSTVHEAIALNAMGCRVAGVSLISNLAAGISKAPLSHDEVIAAGKAAEGRFLRVLEGFCASSTGPLADLETP
ncbi:MAG: purine-nucleoside phosphorylase [Planctomycetes bacterium]|nr:purine-nucleoside phosphorylase [Planctomycetota bacterium]